LPSASGEQSRDRHEDARVCDRIDPAKFTAFGAIIQGDGKTAAVRETRLS
jgi:hypothetical protein